MSDDGIPMVVKQEDGSYVAESQHDSMDEAILAAIDRCEEGDTIRVHSTECRGPDDCHCNPRTWTY